MGGDNHGLCGDLPAGSMTDIQPGEALETKWLVLESGTVVLLGITLGNHIMATRRTRQMHKRQVSQCMAEKMERRSHWEVRKLLNREREGSYQTQKERSCWHLH